MSCHTATGKLSNFSDMYGFQQISLEKYLIFIHCSNQSYLELNGGYKDWWFMWWRSVKVKGVEKQERSSPVFSFTLFSTLFCRAKAPLVYHRVRNSFWCKSFGF